MIRKKPLIPESGVSRITDTDKWLISFALTPALFFTLSGNVLWTYLLPGLPPLALLSGKVLTKWLDQARLFSMSRLTLILFVPVTVTSVVLYASSQAGLIESEKHLVNVYNETGLDKSGPLYYVGILPYSARFYSAGKAKKLDLGQAIDDIKNPVRKYTYLAIRDDQKNEFMNHCMINCKKLARDMRYTLFLISH